jgi:hypothetical protein
MDRGLLPRRILRESKTARSRGVSRSSTSPVTTTLNWLKAWMAHGGENNLPLSSATSFGSRATSVVVDANVDFPALKGFECNGLDDLN